MARPPRSTFAAAALAVVLFLAAFPALAEQPPAFLTLWGNPCT